MSCITVQWGTLHWMATTAQTHIKLYIWSDLSVFVWEKKALRANRSAIEIESDLLVHWFSSRDHLKIGKFYETKAALAVMQ